MESESAALVAWIKSLQMGNVLAALAIAGLVWVLIQGLHRVASSLTQASPSHRLTILRLETLLTFLLYMAGGGGIAAVLLSPQPQLLLALTGSLAVAVGLSLKDVAASVFAGLILLFDQPFQVGDRVTYGGHYGDVVSIGLRSVKILTLGHDTVTIPNSSFLTDAVASGNSGSLSMMVTMKMQVPVEADIVRARELLHEVVVTSRFAWLGNGVSVTVDETWGEDMIPWLVLTARCYVVDVHLEKEFLTDVIMRATLAFREAGIPRTRAGD